MSEKHRGQAVTLKDALLSTPEGSRAYAAEGLALAATELVEEVMRATNTNDCDLAHCAGVSERTLARLLAGETRMTVNRLAELLCVMGYEIEMVAKQIREAKP